jgi:hypothetical protein
MRPVIPRCTSITRDGLPCGSRLVAIPYIDRRTGRRHYAMLCPLHDAIERVPNLAGAQHG